MSERRFRSGLEQECRELARDIEALERGERVDVLLFAARYRLLCQRLSIARHRRYGADLVTWLNELALRGHAQLYRSSASHWLRAVLELLLVAFPRALRAHWRSQLGALALFVLPAAAAFVTIRLEPELVYHFIDVGEVRGIEQMYDPSSDHFLRARPSGDDLQMFGFYIYNNIGIAFRTFASGLLFGVGAAFFVVYNGLLFGAVAGHLHEVGSSHTFYPFVIGHGALELPAIVMAGGTGLAIGFALLAPGARTRLHALQESARACVPILYGFTTMLLGAAFLEAFWSSQHGLGSFVRYAAGSALWLSLIAFVLWGGRSRAA